MPGMVLGLEETEVVNDEKIDEIKDEINPLDVIPAEEQVAAGVETEVEETPVEEVPAEEQSIEEPEVEETTETEFEKTEKPGELDGDAEFEETETETTETEPETEVAEQPAEEEHSLEIPVETYTEVEDIKRINGELSQKIKENKIFAIRKEKDEETGEDTLMFAEPGINGIWLVVLRDGKYIKKIVLF